MYQLTPGELMFLLDTLRECARSNDAVETAVEECIELLDALERVEIDNG